MLIEHLILFLMFMVGGGDTWGPGSPAKFIVLTTGDSTSTNELRIFIYLALTFSLSCVAPPILFNTFCYASP